MQGQETVEEQGVSQRVPMPFEELSTSGDGEPKGRDLRGRTAFSAAASGTSMYDSTMSHTQKRYEWPFVGSDLKDLVLKGQTGCWPLLDAGR